MTHPIRIQSPCPKRWDDLQGNEQKRFCSECSLHVHNSAALTQREAEALVARADGRVCMRIECDPSGAPVFRRDESTAARLARWALGAGAALLAACHGSQPAQPAPAAQPVEPPSRMGKVRAPVEMGDVAVRPPQPPQTLGEAAAPDPAPPKPK